MGFYEYDNGLEHSVSYDYEVVKGLSDYKKKSLDDPTTFDVDGMPEFTPDIVSQDSPVPYRAPSQSVVTGVHGYTFDDSYYCMNDVIVPFRNGSRLLATWFHDNMMFGRDAMDHCLSYDIARGLWYRCPLAQIECYTEPETFIWRFDQPNERLSNFHIRCDGSRRVTPDGLVMLRYLCTSNVDTDKSKQALKAITHGKFDVRWGLLKLFDGVVNCWMMDGEFLNVERLLIDVGGYQS